MKERETPLQIAMFSGGRGTGAITEALLRNPHIELTLLVNAYDDGLSTGLLRRFIPGMLGPSDIRKNVSRFVARRSDATARALLFLLEYRFPDPCAADEALLLLREFLNVHGTQYLEHDIFKARENLSLAQVKKAGRYLVAFLEYYAERIRTFHEFPFGDVSLGNLLFAGCYLLHGQDFNHAIAEFSHFTEIGERILNITNGENRVLVAIKQDGRYLHDEASVVGPQDASRIQEIFLLPDYIDQQVHPLKQYKIDNIRLLRTLESLPTMNPVAEKILREADVIIYGPGTQHSSLFPSYLTSGVAEAITANTEAEKVFIGNIARDYDIQGEDATTLTKAFLWYMGRKAEGLVAGHDVVSRFFFQKPDANLFSETAYVPFHAKEFAHPLEQVTWIDLEGEQGKHAGNKMVAEILHLVEGELQKRIAHVSQKVSFIVPALNEERTIQHVLADLQELHFTELGLEKEIIVVDGSSTDKTFELAAALPGIRAYRTDGKRGRGEALRLGLEKSKGDIIVFFPADGEYAAKDIVRIVSPLVSQEFPVVFGSRAFQTSDLSGTLQRIYGKKGLMYGVSKYGGVLLSVLILLFYQKFVSDPLTSMKGFNAQVFRDLRFVCKGVDFDMELIAKLARAKYMLLEVPVSYQARTVKEGKKITVWDGLACLAALSRFIFWQLPKSQASETYAAEKIAESRF